MEEKSKHPHADFWGKKWSCRMESRTLKIPDGINPDTPVGKLTDDELRSLAASIHRQIGWLDASERDKKRTGIRISAAKSRMTKKRRVEIATAAAEARWQKEQQ